MSFLKTIEDKIMEVKITLKYQFEYISQANVLFDTTEIKEAQLKTYGFNTGFSVDEHVLVLKDDADVIIAYVAFSYNNGCASVTEIQSPNRHLVLALIKKIMVFFEGRKIIILRNKGVYKLPDEYWRKLGFTQSGTFGDQEHLWFISVDEEYIKNLD